MKRCPQCNRTFQDASLRFCLFDGTELVADSPQAQTQPQQPQGGYVPPQQQQPGGFVQPPYVQPQQAQYGQQQQYVPPQYGQQATPRPNKAGAIVAAIVIVLLILGGAGWNLFQRLRPALTGGGGSGATSVSQDELIAAVKDADQAEADARARLDPAPLEGKYIGKQLDKEKSDLQTYQSQGIMTEDKLMSQQFGKMYVSKDGTKAAVQVTETWDVTEYSVQTKQVVKTIPGSVSPQTVILTRGPSGWAVSDIADGLQSLDGSGQ